MRIASITSDRKKTVKALVRLTGQESKYQGAPTFRYIIGPYTVERDGTLEVKDEEADALVIGALVTDRLIEDPEFGNSLHLSFPLAEMEGNQLRNLIFLFHARGYLIGKAVGRKKAFEMSYDLIKILKESAPETIEEFRACYEQAGGKEANKGILLEEDRITITGFPLSEDADVNTAFMDLAEHIVTCAKEMKSPHTKELYPKNEKYNFRCWIIRMGMCGDEYKTTRKILLRNLTGNTAFRTKDQAERARVKQEAARRAAKQAEAERFILL